MKDGKSMKKFTLTPIDMIELNDLIAFLHIERIRLGKTPRRTLTFWRQEGRIMYPLVKKRGGRIGTKSYYPLIVLEQILTIRNFQAGKSPPTQEHLSKLISKLNKFLESPQNITFCYSMDEFDNRKPSFFYRIENKHLHTDELGSDEAQYAKKLDDFIEKSVEDTNDLTMWKKMSEDFVFGKQDINVNYIKTRQQDVRRRLNSLLKTQSEQISNGRISPKEVAYELNQLEIEISNLEWSYQRE